MSAKCVNEYGVNAAMNVRMNAGMMNANECE